MRRHTVFLWSTISVLVISGLIQACGDNAENAQVESVSGGEAVRDVISGQAGGDDINFDISQTTDTDSSSENNADAGVGPDISNNEPLPDDFNEACENNEQCSTGYCIEGPEGKVCTKACLASCPDGWECEGVTNLGGDVTYICVPKFAALCSECTTDANCGGGNQRCIEIPVEGNHCTRTCDAESPCPTGYVCKSVEDELNVCFPTTGSCVCTADLLGEDRECELENEYGLCTGVETCAGPGGWTPCDAKAAAPEICDGWDNDCDGEVDDGVGGESCTKTNEWGTCEGERVCTGPGGLECAAPDPAQESCNNIDDDCDGKTDEVDAVGCSIYYADKDDDGLGAALAFLCLCEATGDYTTDVVGDCNDLNPTIGEGQPEACNGADDDCDGQIDEVDAAGCTDYFRDEDGDGYGVSGDTQCLCTALAPYTAVVGGDCNDGDQLSYPGQTEICNGSDTNCNGVADEADAVGCIPYLQDNDDDGYGVTGLAKCLCAGDGTYDALVGGDCDDENPLVSPGGVELCDSVDNTCNGIVDEECDKDSDGYCNAAKQIIGNPAACPNGGGDCNDFDPDVNPGAVEICDTVDNDCDTLTDEGVEAPCGGCAPVCLLGAGPNSDAPFQESGQTFDGAGLDDNGNVVLDTSSIQLNMIWVANSGQGTISKINTGTGLEEGRYNLCSDPSRTAVDSLGNAWVACRGDGKVIKLALAEDDCIDKNNNGSIETSKDLNGNGVIDGGELLLEGQDECVLFTAQPDGIGSGCDPAENTAGCARALGVDKDDNAWVGYWNSKRLWKVSGETGLALQMIDIPNNPYGLAIDQEGIIWVAGRGGERLVRVDPSTNAIEQLKPNQDCFDPYGMTIDENGSIWIANCCCEHVAFRYKPSTDEWTKVAVEARPRGIAADGNGYVYVANDNSDKVKKIDVNTMAVVASTSLGSGRKPVGMAVDFDGNVWAVNYTTSTASRLNHTDLSLIFEVPTGPSPYTYSDMTGYQQKTVVAPKGTYTHTFQGWQGGETQWMQVGLELNTPSGTSADLRVRAAASEEELEFAVWSPYFGPFPPALPTVNLSAFGAVIGEYMQVEVQLFAEESGSTPILKSVDVVASEF